MEPSHAVLFEPIQVGPLELRSRVFGSAHQPGLAEDGRPGPRYIAYQRERARSGLAMQITGATPIAPSRLWNPATMILNVDASIVPAYQRLAEAVHAEGGRMLAQLLHPGAGEFGGTAEVFSASLHVSELTRQVAREISRVEMERVRQEYAAAADRCRRGELDGVEIAIGWGYLLASFVSPRMNQRHDEYGGDLAARLRYPIEVLAAVRQALGSDRILGVRLCGDELLPDGITAEQAPEIARLLAASGHIDYLNVIAGTNMARLPRVDHWPATPAGVGVWRHLAREVRAVVDIPVATVGRVVSPSVAADILEAGDADLVGLARPLIADPTWLSKARLGRSAEIRPCTAVNACINALLDEEPIHCMVNAELGREGTVEESALGPGRTAVVVGGGPGGIEAARRLSARGFRVVLLEQDDALGGQVRAWSSGPARAEVRRILGWWHDDLRRRGVDVRLRTAAAVATVLAESPALVVLATGARPIPHPAAGGVGDGRPGPTVVDALSAFAGDGWAARAGGRRDGPGRRPSPRRRPRRCCACRTAGQPGHQLSAPR